MDLVDLWHEDVGCAIYRYNNKSSLNFAITPWIVCIPTWVCSQVQVTQVISPQSDPSLPLVTLTHTLTRTCRDTSRGLSGGIARLPHWRLRQQSQHCSLSLVVRMVQGSCHSRHSQSVCLCLGGGGGVGGRSGLRSLKTLDLVAGRVMLGLT